MPNRQTLTRRELYDLVWSKPKIEVSTALGISERGLAKICVRHRVPSPDRGYWTQIAAGQKVKKPPFLKIRDKDLELVAISDSLAALPVDLTDVARRAKEERHARRGRHFDARKFDLKQIDVPPVLSTTVKALRTSKPGDSGEVWAIGDGQCGVKVHHSQIERAITFLSHLTNRLEETGLDVVPVGKAMQTGRAADRLEFVLTERTRIRPHDPTPDELQRQMKREDQLERARRRGDWSNVYGLSSRVWPEFDTVYAGEFVLAITTWGGTGLRKKWADGKTQTVEKLLPDIVAGLRTFLEGERTKREEREEWHRQWQHMANRRSLAKQRKDREEKRIGHLRELVDMQREATDIHGWLASLPANRTALVGTELGRMIEWASTRLSLLERLTTVDAASAAIAGGNLFPEVDELHDPEGDLPT